MDNNNSKAKLFTRGGQITFNNWRMLVEVSLKIIQWGVLLVLLMTAIAFWLATSLETIQASYYYISSIILLKLGFLSHVFHFVWHDRSIDINAVGVLRQSYFRHQVILLIHTLKLCFYFALAFIALLITWFIFWVTQRGRKQAEKQFVRGARLVPPKILAKMLKKLGASNIVIESVPMAKDFEVKHTLIHGTTGSGKGQTFNQFLEQIRRRGDSAIIFDKGCVFTSLFYQSQTDILLNPFDRRCAHWNLWFDATTEPDFENIAESLIPTHGEADPYWVDAARTVFSAVAYRMRNEEDRSISKLLSLLLTAELDVLGEYLKGTQAATLVSDKIEKTAISIRSVLSTYLKSLRFLPGLEDKDAFSIRDWIKNVANQPKSHFLFISSNAEQHAALRPLISMWLAMASISLLSLDENYERRIWFVCDELPTLHKLPQLGETIAEVRKFGGCFILGMQSFSQLQKVYGRATASEIFDLLNTRFFFRSPSSDLANLVSKELGYEDIEHSQESHSYGTNASRDGISIGTQRVTRPLVSPAEIMELADLTAYLRVAAPVPITKINIQLKRRHKICSGFIVREMQAHNNTNHAVNENDVDQTSNKADQDNHTYTRFPDVEDQNTRELTIEITNPSKTSERNSIETHDEQKPTQVIQIELD